MMKKLAVFVLAALSCIQSLAGDIKFPVSSIPAELMQNANAVVREHRGVYEVISKSKAKYTSYYAVTILNPKAKSLALQYLFYDKSRKVSGISANIYDAAGNHMRRIRNQEIADRSAFDGVTLFSDNRYKEVDLSASTYPYTIEIEYEMDYNFLFSTSGPLVLPDEDVSVQNFSYKLLYPKTLKPNYKAVNIDIPPTIQALENERESMEWSLQGVPPVRFEPYAPMASYRMYVQVAPSDFEYDGYTGNMSSWENYGKWQQTLNAGRDLLPDDARAKVKEITASLKTVEEKTKALYEFVQGHTRYVGIQLGIGGYQPFPASVVHQAGYGDCKALSNYMVALLKEAGIKGYYTEVWGGDVAPDIDEKFITSSYGNHIIVSVPNEADTIWLECTSQTKPFGYMGRFTGDRRAIMITESGAKIVRTQSLTAEQNLQSTKADVYVEPTGDARATIRTSYSGIQYENGDLDHYALTGADEQKKWIQTNTQIPSFDIRSFSIVNQKQRVPTAIVTRDLALRRMASVSGKRIFITANLMNRWTDIPPKTDARKSKVVRRSTYTDIDSIHYHLPDGIYPEFLPEPIKVSSRFGEYEASYKVDGDGLLYVRRVKMNKGTFPAEAYNEMVEFYKAMSKADNNKVVFLSKT